ncbi:NUDIX hydrolase [Candidatus Chloroploca asiatica]|uniref:Coenzyme A pyrophosphatase n=1 Tax=Candidatus Chloroploca asiatica TaxID=1506545 RepID=A0A2H3KMR8_9CHLR|nr:CoA pyrophosphatase [Candidatus Chloroploca asiatica]PDV99444.1 coenzyme A pyrophosphatase [Candidatus Chloroploca asiatica]
MSPELSQGVAPATPLLTMQREVVRQAMSRSFALTMDELLILRDLDGQPMRPMQPPPGVTPRASAALLLLYPSEGELWLPLTVRSARLTTHRGEVSLPGGRTDPEDDGPIGTALREAWEELGIRTSYVEPLGTLTPFYIPPSNSRLTPVVGLSLVEPDLHPNPDEVEAAFSVPLRCLFDPAIVQEEIWERGQTRMRVPFFALEGYKVWGATALLLSELLARMRRVGFS